MLRSFFVLITSLFCLNIYSSIDDYIYVNKFPTFSNYGGLGYIQNPSARFHDEGTLAFTWSHNDPYLRGSIVAYPFNWLEASYQYTDVNNALYSSIESFSGSQSYKDKSFDFKIRVYKERKYLPAIAVGIRDLGGTALFASEYIVANKLINNNLDISFGIGWGNLNANSIRNPLISLADRFKDRDYKAGQGGEVSFDSFFSGPSGYFWSLEYHVPRIKGLKLLLEYDGTNYSTEGPEPLYQEKKYNFGFVKNITEGFSVKLFQSRGETINFGFSYRLGLGTKNPRNIEKVKQQKTKNSEQIKIVNAKSDELLYKASLKYLRDNDIHLQRASVENETLDVVYAQSMYSNPAIAVGRTTSILDDISPDSMKKFKVSEINGGMGMYSAEVSRDLFQRYKRFKTATPLIPEINIDQFRFKNKEYKFNPKSNYPAIFNSLTPDLRSQIGGPDGFYFGDLKLTLNSEVLINRNMSLISILSYGIYDNMDPLKLESDSILPRVRTDIVKYLKESREFSITRMQLNYYGQYTKSLYYKFSAGILESMFGGIGMEALYRPYNKNYGIGVDIWDVKQRDYDQLFDFKNYRTITGHLSLYYHEPRSNIFFTIKGGRYLAKDSGITFDVSRIFRSGLRIGAFFSQTDISAEEFGEGSFDKGFYFWIPVHLFSERYFKRTFGWGLRPLTRDGAQMLIHGHPMWGVTDSVSSNLFYRGIDEFYN